MCGFDADMGARLEGIQSRKVDAAPAAPAAPAALDGDDREPVPDGAITMTVSRRERDSILLKRRVMNAIHGRSSPSGDGSP
jgi:hypothetical protein